MDAGKPAKIVRKAVKATVERVGARVAERLAELETSDLPWLSRLRDPGGG